MATSSPRPASPAKRTRRLKPVDAEERALTQFNQLIAKAAPRTKRETAAALNRFRRETAAQIRRAG